MKKLTVILAALVLSAGAIAQTDTTRTPDMRNQQVQPQDDQTLSFRTGKVMMWKDGTWTNLDRDRTLTNGTVINMNGRVTMKDGKIAQLREGETIDRNGVITPAGTDPNRKTGTGTGSGGNTPKPGTTPTPGTTPEKK